MKTINFDYTGGFPLEQPVLKRMQAATLENLTAFVKHIGCEDVGNYVIYGCLIVGANITPGMMYIDGELCPFAGAAGTLATKIKKLTATTNAPFENGSNPPVFIETTAVVDATGTALSAFTRFNYVQDANYVHTDINFTAALLAKLNGIQALAEVNVNPNWTETNPALKSFIQNKPAGNLMTYLHKAIYVVGDMIGSTETITINIPDVGTDNYSVLGDMVSFGSNDQHIFWKTREHNETYFKLQMRDIVNTGGQNLKFYFFIVPN